MKFVPDGRCIYCKRPSDSYEHVIPLGLNGSYVLRMTSCPACRDITSKLERSLLRGSLAQIRVAHKFKTRRPKMQPASFPLLVNKDGMEREVLASAEQHPLVLNMPLFPLPKLVVGNANDVALKPTGCVVYHLNKMDDVLSAHSADSVGVVSELQYKEYARLLAKAAYGFLVGELGAARVKGDYLLPIIFGDLSTAGLYIGSSDKVLTAEENDPAVIYNCFRRAEKSGGGEISIVTIRLLPHMLKSPAYIVICDLNESVAP